jgi:hypothetical protein
VPPIKNANPNVSNAILKALGNDARGRPQISAAEMKAIKQTAAKELRASENPTATLKAIKSSFDLANRVTGNEYKEKFGELVSGDLKDVAARRQQNLRQVDTNDWNPPARPYRGNTT